MRANTDFLPVILSICCKSWPADQKVWPEPGQIPHAAGSALLPAVGLCIYAGNHVCQAGTVHQQELPLIGKTCTSPRERHLFATS